MSVITISRQMGSLGDEIAHLLADRLGYSLVNRELINRAAAKVGSPDLALAMIDELGLLGISPSDDLYQQYINAVAKVLQDIAAQGRAVIVGRGGHIVLRDFPGTIHILVTAPLEFRRAHIAAQQNITIEAAENQIRAGDRHRGHYFERFYNVKWLDSDWYDLVINSSRISVEKSVDIIMKMV
jgi:cytidylate kinase